MDIQTFVPALLVVALVVGVVTWLAISVRHPRLRGFLRYLLLTVAIASTTLLIVSVALYAMAVKGNVASPAAIIPLMLAIICAGVAVPTWIGFIVQALYKSGKQPTTGDAKKIQG